MVIEDLTNIITFSRQGEMLALHTLFISARLIYVQQISAEDETEPIFLPFVLLSASDQAAMLSTLFDFI